MKRLPKLIGLPFLNNPEQFPRIILASVSPRRKSLLKQMGLEFDVIPSSVNEDFSLQLSAHKFAEYYAQEKAKDVGQENHNSLVIGADTIVVLKNKILGKPSSYEEAYFMLSSLSGNVHSVITGVSLQWVQNSISHTFHSKTEVTLKTLSKEEIEFYIENYKPYDKAGSYGIQDWFSVCVDKIDGCYFNVMGLPLNKLYNELETVLKI
jgi:septum formation protein